MGFGVPVAWAVTTVVGVYDVIGCKSVPVLMVTGVAAVVTVKVVVLKLKVSML